MNKQKSKKLPQCYICEKDVFETPLFRKRVLGVLEWSCRKHLGKKPNPEVEEIVNLIHNANR